MSFSYQNGQLYCEQVRLAEIAEAVGTPCYVYSGSAILDAWRAYDKAFEDMPHLVCFAVKSNSNLSILRLLAEAGAGFDIVSGGELFRVLRAGGDPKTIVFSGVGKTEAEIELALTSGIGAFNCESEGELAAINRVAERLGMTAEFSLRVNPDVDAKTHKKISTGLSDHKFGVDIADAPAIYARSLQFTSLKATGVSCHIGSQILDYSPILEAADKVLGLVEKLQADGHAIRHVDLGGGLGIAYDREKESPSIERFIADLRERIGRDGLTVAIEPGRSIVGNAGVLLTRVLYLKQSPTKHFVVADAAMNDLIRPTLYNAEHDIQPLRETGGSIIADVVGPVCETGDYLALGRNLPDVQAGDLLAVMSAGAYGFVQASNYNSRPRPAEVLVEGDKWRVVRTRETQEDLIRGEE